MEKKSLVLPTPLVESILKEDLYIIRLPIHPQPKSKLAYISMGYRWGSWRYPAPETWEYWEDESFKLPEDLTEEDRSRYWQPPCHADETLYVKETWTRGYIESSGSEGVTDAWFEERLHTGGAGYLDAQTRWFYRAGMDKAEAKTLGIRWRPATQMPREAARLFLHTKQVSVELSENSVGEPEWVWVISLKDIRRK